MWPKFVTCFISFHFQTNEILFIRFKVFCGKICYLDWKMEQQLRSSLVAPKQSENVSFVMFVTSVSFISFLISEVIHTFFFTQTIRYNPTNLKRKRSLFLVSRSSFISESVDVIVSILLSFCWKVKHYYYYRESTNLFIYVQVLRMNSTFPNSSVLWRYQNFVSRK